MGGIWICKKCGTHNSWDSSTCGCGHHYDNEPHLWVCSQCGTINPWQTDYCTKCGDRYEGN